MPEFIKMLSDSFTSTKDGGIEDCITQMNNYPTMNNYWLDKEASLEKIDVPAYIVASYTNPIHTYGTLEGYRRISSKDKWLRIHNTGEWDDYYNKEHTEDLRKFFDYYLKEEKNNWFDTPKVRMSVLNPGGEDIVDRIESEYPLARTKHKKLYLDSKTKEMVEDGILQENSVVYNSDKKEKVVFKYKIKEDTEISGYIKLRLWVSALDNDDMDLFVKMEKRNKYGLKYKYTIGPGCEASSTGYMRVSLRELDKEKSTEENPRQSMLEMKKLKKGEIVPVDILLWPVGLMFKKGDILTLTITAYKTKKL